MSRDIKYIVLHCTATSHDAKVESIKNYWKNKLGWKSVGYHYLIDKNGVIHQLADESEITNGVRGYNSVSLHISYIGGKDRDDRTKEQQEAQRVLVKMLHNKYPKAIIQGHRDFDGVSKSCPRFNVKEWLKTFELK